MKTKKIAVIGGGNIGQSLAKGLIDSGKFLPKNIIVTRRNCELLEGLKKLGCVVTSDNKKAVVDSDIIFIAVLPQQVDGLLCELKDLIDPDRHIIVSIATGVTTDRISKLLNKKVPVVRAMPNTAIAIRESMTCISSKHAEEKILEQVKGIFSYVGTAIIIAEEQMTAATVLCACGIAFFLRAIRAASQGGIEIGFHSYEAIPMAAQTAKGAAALLLGMENHPESEIDKVTTPRGCTISGLNEMEHQGFSSAMIKGIITSAQKAASLYTQTPSECDK